MGLEPRRPALALPLPAHGGAQCDREQLIGAIRESYGIAKEEAERQAEEWRSRLEG